MYIFDRRGRFMPWARVLVQNECRYMHWSSTKEIFVQSLSNAPEADSKGRCIDGQSECLISWLIKHSDWPSIYHICHISYKLSIQLLAVSYGIIQFANGGTETTVFHLGQFESTLGG